MRRLRLYHRPGCHLCEQMQEQLEPYRRNGRLDLDLVDVDMVDTDLSSYLERIPLLETPQGESLCEYFLDEDALLSYLDGG
ncbi:MAG: glutaredoxin family protein [Chromatiales bacterium]